jgi:hypothetical protein
VLIAYDTLVVHPVHSITLYTSFAMTFVEKEFGAIDKQHRLILAGSWQSLLQNKTKLL